MTLPLRWYLTQLLQKYTLHFDKIYRSREINRVTKITMFWKPQSVNFGPLQSTSEFCVHLVRSWWEKGEGFLKRSLVEGKERSGRGGRDRIAGRKKEGVERVEGECRNLEPGSVRHKIKGVIYATRSKQQLIVAWYLPESYGHAHAHENDHTTGLVWPLHFFLSPIFMTQYLSIWYLPLLFFGSLKGFRSILW